MPRKQNVVRMKGKGRKMDGKVVWFNNTYGFVKADTTGDEYFVHESVIDMDGFRTLKKDQKVTFEVELGPKQKPQAVNVQVVK
jgi:CspA family cold shock protein